MFFCIYPLHSFFKFAMICFMKTQLVQLNRNNQQQNRCGVAVRVDQSTETI